MNDFSNRIILKLLHVNLKILLLHKSFSAAVRKISKIVIKKRNSLRFFVVFLLFCSAVEAQNLKSSRVPAAVKTALREKYYEAKNVSWEKEHDNYEANWGGKSGEENSVQFTPDGKFIEIVKAILVSELPKSVRAYVRTHYKEAKITEAGRVSDAKGQVSYEAEVNRKDIIFDENGNFIKAER